MSRNSFDFRKILLWAFLMGGFIIAINFVRWWWSICNDLPDASYLITTNEIVVKAGCQDVRLPKGLVLYPVNEQEANDECYPGGHYKIYVSLETDGSDLNSIGWPKGMTNLIHQLRR